MLDKVKEILDKEGYFYEDDEIKKAIKYLESRDVLAIDLTGWELDAVIYTINGYDPNPLSDYDTKESLDNLVESIVDKYHKK